LRVGLPHSEIPGSTIARISPGLFAACRVLHRLSVPRHPPDALASRSIQNALDRQSPKPDDRPRRRPGKPPRTGASPTVVRTEGQPRRGPRMKTLFGRHPRAGSHLRPRPVRLGHIHKSIHPSINTGPETPAAAAGSSPPGRPEPRNQTWSSPNAVIGRQRTGDRSPPPSRSAVVRESGGERDRTDDLLLAKQALSQLSYTPLQRSEIRTPRSEAF
jgi:hypothetical protein